MSKFSKFSVVFAAAIIAFSMSAYSQQIITCSSDDGNRHSCTADVRGGVQLSNQRSGSACQRGYSWGTDQNGIWVDRGCRADFVIAPYNPYPQSGSAGTINCSSDDGGRRSCPADVRGGVQLTNQRSGSPCQQGYSWGTDQQGIWVDRGCRADFTVTPYNPYTQSGQAGTITCSSDDGRRRNCAADTSGGVLLLNQRSGSPCTRGYSWGDDQNGIWVDRGCRADFQIGSAGGGNYYPSSGAIISCSSDDGNRRSCSANTSGGVRMVRQNSGSPCRRGSTWGTDERGIWVDRGCRADFEVGRGRR